MEETKDLQRAKKLLNKITLYINPEMDPHNGRMSVKDLGLVYISEIVTKSVIKKNTKFNSDPEKPFLIKEEKEYTDIKEIHYRMDHNIGHDTSKYVKKENFSGFLDLIEKSRSYFLTIEGQFRSLRIKIPDKVTPEMQEFIPLIDLTTKQN